MPNDHLAFIARPRVGTTRLRSLPTDAIHAYDINRTAVGEPLFYTVEGFDLVIHPVPDDCYLIDKYCWWDNRFYVCLKEHQAALDEDDDGLADTSVHGDPSNNSTGDWELVDYSVDPRGTTYANYTDFAWSAGKSYFPGTLSMAYKAQLTRMLISSDSPILPSQHYPALITGTCWLMRQNLMRDDAVTVDRVRDEFLGMKRQRVEQKWKRSRYENRQVLLSDDDPFVESEW